MGAAWERGAPETRRLIPLLFLALALARKGSKQALSRDVLILHFASSEERKGRKCSGSFPGHSLRALSSGFVCTEMWAGKKDKNVSVNE